MVALAATELIPFLGILCVVRKRVFPQYASQVGRALMSLLRRWPDEFGGHWFGALNIWATLASWTPELLCRVCRISWQLHVQS